MSCRLLGGLLVSGGFSGGNNLGTESVKWEFTSNKTIIRSSVSKIKMNLVWYEMKTSLIKMFFMWDIGMNVFVVLRRVFCSYWTPVEGMTRRDSAWGLILSRWATKVTSSCNKVRVQEYQGNIDDEWNPAEKDGECGNYRGKNDESKKRFLSRVE